MAETEHLEDSWMVRAYPMKFLYVVQGKAQAEDWFGSGLSGVGVKLPIFLAPHIFGDLT